MFKKGDYVSFVMAPNARNGTLESDRTEKGQYLFKHDPRFHDTIPTSYVYEDEIELCNRPTDGEVAVINTLNKHES